jgi:hypothetical protein
VTFGNLRPIANNGSSVPSGIATLSRIGDYYTMSWPLGTFDIKNVASATSEPGMKVNQASGFGESSWNSMKVGVQASIYVSFADVKEYMDRHSESGRQDWNTIVISNKDDEMDKLVQELLE